MACDAGRDVAYRLERDLWKDTSRLVARLCDVRG
jgi:hypothetical protein